jgi:acylphosphatase
MKRVRVVVAGRVQGVFFRDSARQEAERLGVRGWVQNLPDGTVEAVFEGAPARVDGLVAWCHQGPERAQVEEVLAREEEPTGEFLEFRIAG